MPLRLARLISLFISFCLILEQSAFAQSLDLSAHFANFGRSIAQTDKFRPLHLRYLGYDNLKQDFKLLLDRGDSKKEDLENKAYIEENTQTLLRYFFIGLSLPNDKFWVNLRPDSPDNILDPDLERTDIGRIFLEADLQLKKDTAQWTSPQTPEGKVYWDKLYKKAGELFGSENITIPTITRPWIVPNEIIIRESPEDAYIYKATLKVMLEEDYLKSPQPSAVGSQPSEPNYQPLTTNYSFSDPRMKELNQYSTQLIKEQILPKLTYEVNTAKRYAQLRQVYYSLILAQWFKARYRSQRTENREPKTENRKTEQANNYISLIDSGNLTNLLAQEPYDKQTYFKEYQKSFKDGEYNLSEPTYTPFGQSIRRYMSGGLKVNLVMPEPSTANSSIVSIATASAASSLEANPHNLGISSNDLRIIEEAQPQISASPMEEKPLSKEESVLKGIVREGFLEPGISIITDDMAFNSFKHICTQFGIEIVLFAKGSYLNRDTGRAFTGNMKKLYEAIFKYLDEHYGKPNRVILLPRRFNEAVLKHELIHDITTQSLLKRRDKFISLAKVIRDYAARDNDFEYAFEFVANKIGYSFIRLNTDERIDFLSEFISYFFSGELQVVKSGSRLDRMAADSYLYILSHMPNEARQLFYEIGFIWPSVTELTDINDRPVADIPPRKGDNSFAVQTDIAIMVYDRVYLVDEALFWFMHIFDKFRGPLTLKEYRSFGLTSERLRQRFRNWQKSDSMVSFFFDRDPVPYWEALDEFITEMYQLWGDEQPFSDWLKHFKGTLKSKTPYFSSKDKISLNRLEVKRRDASQIRYYLAHEFFQRLSTSLMSGQRELLRQYYVNEILQNSERRNWLNHLVVGYGEKINDAEFWDEYITQLFFPSGLDGSILTSGLIAYPSGTPEEGMMRYRNEVLQRFPFLNVIYDKALQESRTAIAAIQEYSLKGGAGDVKAKGTTSSPASPPVTSEETKTTGGIDFTRLPIVTQAITNLGSSPLRPSSYLSLRQLNLSEEYQAIERLASSGITPSPERLKSFLQASGLQDKIGEERDNALGLLTEVLRQEESNLRPTEAGLLDILVALESITSPQQLKEIFLGKIN